MSYLVIARKWRPNLFSEVIGQEHVTRTLENAVSSGRIAHAYLFSGPRGVGKTTAARILAKCINCEKGPTPEPCNECPNCTAIANSSSVDVMEIDGASNTSVDNVRELRESIKFMPTSSRYKVYVIDEVHMLSTSAFNALLKTLEEPPPHAVFIFATTEVHKIPRTILSRCQRFDFKRIPFKEITAHLKHIAGAEGIEVESGVLEMLAREGEGSMRDAESLLDQLIAFSGAEIKGADAAEALGLMDRSVLFDLSEAVLSRDSNSLINIIEKVYEFGYDLKKVCQELLEHIRDLTVFKVTDDPGLLELPPSEIERLKGLIEGATLERLQMVFGVVSKGYEEVARSSTPRFSLEMALLRAAHIDELKPIGEVIETLRSLGGAAVSPCRNSFDPVKPAKREKPVSLAGGLNSGAGEGDLLGFVSVKDPKLADFLKDADISEGADAVDIKIAGPAGFLELKKGALETILSDFYKRRIRVNIIIGQGNGKGKDEGAASDGELVDAAIKILGGRVVEDGRRKDVKESR